MKEQITSTSHHLYFNPSLACLSKKINEIDCQSLVPHRTEVYSSTMKDIDSLLLKILGNDDFVPVLLSGNGTLANEIMVANLILFSRTPAVIINGEFGKRLYEQCLKYNPDVIAIDFGFANNINLDKLEEKLKNIDTLFFVSLETSAGIMNPVKEICRLCEELEICIGIDAVSAMGAEKIDFSSKQISFISTSSGKNLVSIPGISIVFMRKNMQIKATSSLPNSIDMAFLLKSKSSLGSVKNTLSYFLVKALYVSLNELISTRGLSKQHETYIGFRQIIITSMKTMEINVLKNCNASNILSFHCPNIDSWNTIKKVLDEHEISIYDQAVYLREKNIFQIAYMGFYSKEDIERMLYAFSVAKEIKK